MNLEARLDESIARWNLLESRFYQAWSAGTLPVEALRTYAAEYGAFISLIPQGWEGHGDTATAAVEHEHLVMWDSFAQALRTQVGAAETAGVQQLCDTAGRLFEQKAASLGALYAFEAQQPATSRSKLEGLREHYNLPKAGDTYFEVHAHDEAEPRMLLDRIGKLSPEEQETAVAACEETARALHVALDALYDRHAAACVQ